MARQAASSRRRARKRGCAVVTLTADDWKALLRQYKYRCAYCNSHSPRLTQDHVQPISRAGQHTKSNIVPCCDECNQKKGSLTLKEFTAKYPALRGPRILGTVTMADVDVLLEKLTELQGDIKEFHSELQTVQDWQANQLVKNEGFATKAHLEQLSTQLWGTLNPLLRDTVSRADLKPIENAVGDLKVAIETKYATVASRAEIISKGEIDARFGALSTTAQLLTTNITSLQAQLQGMSDRAQNRLWDIIKIALPYAVLGGTLAATVTGHLVLH